MLLVDGDDRKQNPRFRQDRIGCVAPPLSRTARVEFMADSNFAWQSDLMAGDRRPLGFSIQRRDRGPELLVEVAYQERRFPSQANPPEASGQTCWKPLW
jgi:hypothetical protein